MDTLTTLVICFLAAALLLNLSVTFTMLRRLNRISKLLTAQPELAPGSAAPNFQAYTLDGESVTLRHFNAGAVFIFFRVERADSLEKLLLLDRFALELHQLTGIELVLVSESSSTKTRKLVDALQLRTQIIVAPRTRSSFASQYNPSGENLYYCVIGADGVVLANGSLQRTPWDTVRRAWLGMSQNNRAKQL